MTEPIISGLLIQKGTSPAPNSGEERWLSWEQKQGKSLKPYIKIKNNSQEYGGTLCTIIDAERTDFTDQHGNVSYNVGFTPKASNNGDDIIPMDHDKNGQPLAGVTEAKQHLMRCVNFYNLCVDAVDTIVKPNVNGMTAEMYQAAVSSVFIEGSRLGMIAKMPITKLK